MLSLTGTEPGNVTLSNSETNLRIKKQHNLLFEIVPSFSQRSSIWDVKLRRRLSKLSFGMLEESSAM